MGAKFSKFFHKKKSDEVDVWLEPPRATKSSPELKLNSFQEVPGMWDADLEADSGELTPESSIGLPKMATTPNLQDPNRKYSVMSAESNKSSSSSSSSSGNEILEESAGVPLTVSDWVVTAPSHSVKPIPDKSSESLDCDASEHQGPTSHRQYILEMPSPCSPTFGSPCPPHQSHSCSPPQSKNCRDEEHLEFIKAVLKEEKKPCKEKKCKKPESGNGMFGLESSDMVLGLILIHQMLHGSQTPPQPPCPSPPCYPCYPYPSHPSMMCYGNPYGSSQSCCQPMCPQSCCQPMCPQSCCQPMYPQSSCQPMCPQSCCQPMCPQPCSPPMCPQPCYPPMCPQPPAQMSAQAWQNAVFPENLGITRNYRKVQKSLAKQAVVNTETPTSGIKLRFLDTDEDGGTTSADEY